MPRESRPKNFDDYWQQVRFELEATPMADFHPLFFASVVRARTLLWGILERL